MNSNTYVFYVTLYQKIEKEKDLPMEHLCRVPKTIHVYLWVALQHWILMILGGIEDKSNVDRVLST